MVCTLSSSVHISAQITEVQTSKISPLIGLYLPSAFIAAATKLTSEAAGQAAHLAMDSHIYAKPWNPAAIVRFLESQIQRRIATDAATGFWIEASGSNGEMRLIPRLEKINFLIPKYKNLQITFHTQEQTCSVEIPLGQVANLVSNLCRWYQAGLPESVAIDLQQLFHFLQDHKAFLLTPENVFSAPPTSLTSPVITSMGHAFLVLDYQQKRYLFDPWIFQNQKDSAKPQVTIGDLGKIDGVFITHHHPDHFDLGTLLNLDPTTPIYVPKHQGAWHEPKYGPFLKDLGFQNITELTPGQISHPAKGLTIHSLPFYGEGKNILKFAAQCFAIQTASHNILIHADAGPDSANNSILKDKTLANFVRQHGPIKDIYATWWQLKVFLYQLDPWAIFAEGITSKDWLSATELCEVSCEFLSDLIKTSKAQRIIFYADNGVELFFPPEKRSAFVSTVSYFWQTREEITQEIKLCTDAQIINAEPWLSLKMN